MSNQDRMRVFEYKRGDEYSVKVVVNERGSSTTFIDITVPDNTPNKVKDAFLEEAEKAIIIQLDKEEYSQYGY